MITFRYHLVSLAAVLLALAAGVVLGAGPLDSQLGGSDGTLSEAQQAQVDALQEQVATGETLAAYNEAVAESLGTALIPRQLRGRSVVVVVMPDTDPALVSTLADAVTTAGAQVTGEVDVLPTWVDPEQGTVLGGLATQLAPADADVGSGNIYANAGAALASALVTNDAVPPAQSDTESVALLTGFQEGGFISVSGDPAVRAQLALVVSPPGPLQADDASSAYTDALLPLVAALDAGQGAVLVGPAGSAREGGLVAALRASGPVRRTVSSDDVADLASGPVATVLALVEQQGGVTGQYGVGPGAQAALPPVPAVRPVRR